MVYKEDVDPTKVLNNSVNNNFNQSQLGTWAPQGGNGGF